MNLYYNQKYSKEQIAAVLKSIQDCVQAKLFIVSLNQNRQENVDFINEYNITNDKMKGILLKITPEDFCHTLQNTKIGYEEEVLYVFCPQVMLFNFEGKEKKVDVYTKFNLIRRKQGQLVVVISFHKPKKPVKYLFR